MTQPPGFVDDKNPFHVCKLIKALYGLKQAPRARHHGDVMYVIVYVDDILLTGSNTKLVHGIVHKLNTEFALKTLGSLKYFLGFEVRRIDTSIHMNQAKYARDLLVKTGMMDAKSYLTPMTLGNKLNFEDSELFDKPSLYRSTIGTLQYLTLSRPDIAYSINKLIQFLKALTQLHWQACKRLLRYLKGTTHFGVHFTKVSRFHLECFTDADWEGNLQDRRSTSGCCPFLGSNLLQWSSKKYLYLLRRQNIEHLHKEPLKLHGLGVYFLKLIMVQTATWKLLLQIYSRINLQIAMRFTYACYLETAPASSVHFTGFQCYFELKPSLFSANQLVFSNFAWKSAPALYVVDSKWTVVDSALCG
ncbi:uncharacterized protein LOC116140604 [Pistacia vera]|uniref:uncharacterized protein LOC116140604 n=1 Tax=Pistacia vera TaxID=55513 RepID=UPI0012637190|nr:uncharacterized protein LOC116140604 [Pistacia vera]